MSDKRVLSIDAMGGDNAPGVVIEGLSQFLVDHPGYKFLLHGREEMIGPLLERHDDVAGASTLREAADSISMEDKPSQALRKRGSSMWSAVNAVKEGEADAIVSAGNTGALMAISMMALRRMDGVHRPAMTALWPTLRGRIVVLDVGANLEADAQQLLTFAIMGEAFARAIRGVERPSIGILNVGSEEQKGHDEVRRAAELIKASGLDLNYKGFIEGNDISAGTVDVVVTDGFSGNIALKTAEGTARLVAGFVREALTSSPVAKAGALLASGGLRRLKERMDPSNVNGGVLLGLNGVSVKSHGATDAKGFATALRLAADLSESDFHTEVANQLAKVRTITEAGADASATSESAA